MQTGQPFSFLIVSVSIIVRIISTKINFDPDKMNVFHEHNKRLTASVWKKFLQLNRGFLK